MNTIIQQIAVKMIEQILSDLLEKGVSSIGETVQSLTGIVRSTVLELISSVLQQMDDALCAAQKDRRADGLRVKERAVPRTVLTEMGELTYARTYFESKEGSRCYLLDHLIQVESYERLTKELSAALVQQAADKSMAKAAKDMGVAVSRQTVNNRVLALKEVAISAERARETPRELHVFVDEDHVHLKTGKSAIVPLVTVTEGIDTATTRHKTINAVHFEGYGMSNAALFENVSAFLYERYDVDRLYRIYIYADGGLWIKAAPDYLPNTKFVMDGFHLQKVLRKLMRLPGAMPHIGALREAMKQDDYAGFADRCRCINENLDEPGKETLAELEGYFKNNWESIVARQTEDICGSCTEPLVSHVLSERLSRNPLAWSEDGLRQMAMLQVYTKNGGVVQAKDIRISRDKEQRRADKLRFTGGFEKYRAYADKQIDTFLKQKLDWSIFDAPRERNGKLTGTRVLLNALARLNPRFPSSRFPRTS